MQNLIAGLGPELLMFGSALSSAREEPVTVADMGAWLPSVLSVTPRCGLDADASEESLVGSFRSAARTAEGLPVLCSLLLYEYRTLY